MNEINLSTNAEEPINIGFWAHKRAIRNAQERLGSGWNETHDRYVIRQLFRAGEITEYQKQTLLDAISEKVRAKRRRNPNHGKFRLW